MQRTDEDRAKARCYTKATRRGLSFRSCPKLDRVVPRYRILREDGLVVWWADHIGDAESYLDKSPPREWVD